MVGLLADFPTKLMPTLSAYAFLWSLQIFEQALLNGPGFALKGQPLLALFYLVHFALAVRAARSGSTKAVWDAHVSSIILYLWKLPYMWDEDHWAVRTDAVVLFAIFASDAQAAILAEASAVVPYIMALFYSGSAFWKLNLQFFEPRGSCGTIYFVTLLGLAAPEAFLKGTEVGQGLLWLAANAAPALTIVVEMGIAVLLLAPPRSTMRRCGVFLAMLLHLLIAITPEPFNVSEYSIVCIVRMYFLLPDATTQALADWSGAAFSTKLAILGVALASGALNLNPLGVIGTPIYVWLFMLFCRALYLDATMPPLTTTAPPPAPTKRYLKWHVLESAAFCYLLLALGLADQGPSKPFANIKASHGQSNHFFAPLNLLPRLLAEYPPSFTLGGGTYRVDDCNATIINEVFPGV